MTAGSRVLTVGLAAVFSILACTSNVSPVGLGGECFIATDCLTGLICVEQANKTRICTDDLSRVAGRPPPTDAGEAGVTDGSKADVSVPPLEDTGAPDSGTFPGDSGADG